MLYIVHRDLKSDSIFINTSIEVHIGVGIDNIQEEDTDCNEYFD